jgi:uncharacterized protein YgiM (DUF1202 family)
MHSYAKPFAIGLMVSLLSLGVSACRDRKESSKREELPDLNAQTYAYVTVERTRVRTGPGTQFRSIAEIPANARVNAVGRDGDWVLIVSKKGNAPGFVEMAALTPADGEAKESLDPRVEGRYEALAETSVRSGPGLHYPVVAKISKGTKLNVVDEEKGWLKVESKRGNEPGYVEANLAKPVGE